MTETPSARRRVLRPAAIGLAAAAMLAASGLAPALAATGPSMTVNHNSVNIAIQGPGNRLKFYWADNGTTTWHPETVAGVNSTYSAPSMTVDGNIVNIAAMGPAPPAEVLLGRQRHRDLARRDGSRSEQHLLGAVDDH